MEKGYNMSPLNKSPYRQRLHHINDNPFLVFHKKNNMKLVKVSVNLDFTRFLKVCPDQIDFWEIMCLMNTQIGLGLDSLRLSYRVPLRPITATYQLYKQQYPCLQGLLNLWMGTEIVLDANSTAGWKTYSEPSPQTVSNLSSSGPWGTDAIFMLRFVADLLSSLHT